MKIMAEEKWLVDGPKVIDLGPIRRLKVALVRGQVDIVGHDEPTTRVEVHSVSGKDLRVSFDNGVLEIDHPQLRWDNFIDVFRSFHGTARADVSILVPRDIALTLGVVSSSGLVSGLRSDASISTVNGDLLIDGLTGDITLNAVNGELAIQNHTGRIAAHTVNGEITASGAISQFSSDGVSGDVFLDITGSPELIRVNAVNGSVTARLEEGNSAEYRVNTVNGRIQLDDLQVVGVHGSYTGKFGSLERSFLEFRVNTVSGNVTVLHSGGSGAPTPAAAKKGKKA
jgi:DUF4097 and DUF4098 domain-containing protein YvlB